MVMKFSAKAALVLAAFAGSMLSANPAKAETASWRLTTVTATMQAGETIRKGVAIFSNGQPAFVTVRLRPTAQPAQGSMPFSTETEDRFEDRSSFTVLGHGVTRMSPEGVPMAGENRIDGKFIAGTGRFAGITGTVSVRTVSGMNRTTDGALGDSFGEAQADYTSPK